MTTIYKIINNINGKLYIGKTINLKQRWYKHCYLARKGEIKKHLYAAMRKYGIDNFSIETIEECDDDLADEHEKYWIRYYNTTDKDNGYNCTFGGEGGNTWELNTHKEKTSALLSINAKKQIWTEERKANLSKALKGRVISDEAKHKTSETLKRKYASGEIQITPPPGFDRTGCKHTDESKTKMSLAKKDKTYEDIYGSDADRIKEIRRKAMIKDQNPNHKDIDMDLVQNMLHNGIQSKDVAKYFNTSYQTIWNKCKNHFGKTPSQIKEEIHENIF